MQFYMDFHKKKGHICINTNKIKKLTKELIEFGLTKKMLLRQKLRFNMSIY